MPKPPLTVGMDTAPVTLYAKKDLDSAFAEALLAGSDNILLVNSGLVPAGYDYISLSPASKPTTVVFKTGGSGGTVLSTLTIAYDGNDISSVTRT